MPGIRIRDLTERGFLAFDLADLLDLLGDPARTSIWRCSVEECISSENARPYLEDAYNTPQTLTGAELAALARETRQVIDGRFEAFRRGANTPWIRLEAIDSTCWEVFAPDSTDLSRLELHFREVERIGEGDV
jgi:hypothetical protein